MFRGRRLVFVDTPMPPMTMRITTEFVSAPDPGTTLQHCILPEGKTAGIAPCADDGGLAIYTHLLKCVQGVETGDGFTYPGLNYTDGCGNNIPWSYSLAINANSQHDENSGNFSVSTWAQLQECWDAGFFPTTHGFYHGGDNAVDIVKQISDNQKSIWDHHGIPSYTGVPPSADEGYVITGSRNHTGMWNSTFGVTSMMDGFQAERMDNDRIKPTALNLNRSLCSRMYTGTETDAGDVAYFKTLFNNMLAASTGIGNEYYIFSFFHHGITNNGTLENYNEMMQYIVNHPANNDRVGVWNYQKIWDYEKVRRGVTKAEVIVGNKLITELYFNDIDAYTYFLDTSFHVTGAGVGIKAGGIKVNGADTFTKNETTGLINLYAKNPNIINPHDIILPPKITAIAINGSNPAVLDINYDRAVTQSLVAGYSVEDNTTSSITGSGTSWSLTCGSSIVSGKKFYYRPQNGNAVDANDPTLFVGSFINYLIP